MSDTPKASDHPHSPPTAEKPSEAASRKTDPMGTDEIASDTGPKDEIPGIGPRSPLQRKPIPNPERGEA